MQGRSFFVFKAPDRRRLPNPQEQSQRDDRSQGRQNVRQFGSEIVRGEPLQARESNTSNQASRQTFHAGFPASHQGNQPNRNDYGKERQLTAYHGADLHGIHARNLTSNDNRNTDTAESNRSRVSNQTQTCGVQRVETQTHQHAGGDSNRSTEASSAFQERSKSEGNQQSLQTTVIGNSSNRVFNNLELSRFYSNIVNKNSHNNDPENREDTVKSAHTGSRQSQSGWHLVRKNSNQYRRSYSDGASDVTRSTTNSQHVENNNHRNSGYQRG